MNDDERIKVGIVASVFPGWSIPFSHLKFDVAWILLTTPTWKQFIKQAFPKVLVLILADVDWNKLDMVSVVACNGTTAAVQQGPLGNFGALYMFDWTFRPRRGWKDWNAKILQVQHYKVSGVTDYGNKFLLLVHPSSKHSFTFDGVQPVRYPNAPLDSILDCTVKEGTFITAPRLPSLATLAVFPVKKRVFHPKGLLPLLEADPQVQTTCVFSPTKWIERRLSTKEWLLAFDVPVSMHPLFNNKLVQQLRQDAVAPHKCLNMCLSTIFHVATVQVVGGGRGISSSPAVTIPPPVHHHSTINVNNNTALPPTWIANTKHDLDEKAVKSDNADIPIQFWNNALALKLGLTEGLSPDQEAGVEILRNFLVHRIWKHNVTTDFCKYIWCKPCYRLANQHRWKGVTVGEQKDEVSVSTCSRCAHRKSNRNREETMVMLVADSGSHKHRAKYGWKPNGRMAYKRFYHRFRQTGNTSIRQEIELDIKAARDCITRATKASPWNWNNGSRLFFWRWGEFELEARDGDRVFVQAKLPKCQDKQTAPKDKRTLDLVREKLSDVRKKGYISKEKIKVKSVTSFFDVPKGNEDIRMVYNATSSGLNEAVWAPWFALPTVETHLRGVVPGTYMVDCDLGEMFLNFMLDLNIRPYAGVDLTKIFPEELTEVLQELIEHWERMLMGFRPSPYFTTRALKRVETFLKGDRHADNNIFRWDKVIFNLPGDASYTPTHPRVYRVRVDGDTMAADLFIYIDDLRNTAPSELEGWEGAHQICCRLAWLGIQDAPRKRNYSSQTPRAWAGSIVHSDQDAVTLLVSEEKWIKTKKWIDWVLENVSNAGGMCHKKLLSCRGFLIYVSRTYRPFKPYLRGLHKTIDGWRPFRDEEGWKLTYAIMEAKEQGVWGELLKLEPDEFIKPVKRLKADFQILKRLTSANAPPKVIRRRTGCGVAIYGFGDASGKGFGSCIEIEGISYSQYGQWSACIEEKHSNYKELKNLVMAVEKAYQDGKLDNCELYLFTDNYVAECAYYNGGSNLNRELDELVFRLWEMQMEGTFTLYFYHVAGTRMIASGIDGLSRGDKAEGVSRGMSIMDFIPLHLSPMTRSPKLEEWLRSWGTESELGKLEILSPEDWFDKEMDVGTFVWDVPPAAGEAAVEQLCCHVHGRPNGTHIFLIPRLCTSHWRKQLGKVCDILITLHPKHEFWDASMHEPLMLGIYLPLLPPLYKYRPWRFKYTQYAADVESEVLRMQQAGGKLEWDCLRKLFTQARTICTMPDGVARKLLQTKRG